METILKVRCRNCGNIEDYCPDVSLGEAVCPICNRVDFELFDLTKPSSYFFYPWNSVLQNSQSETIALNVMKILARTGNKFRPLKWEEYKEERLCDGNFSDQEKRYFDNVIEHCISPDTAKLFSKEWAFN